MSTYKPLPDEFVVHREYDDAGIRIIRSLDHTVVALQFAEGTTWEQDTVVAGVLMEEGFSRSGLGWRRDDDQDPQFNLESIEEIVDELVSEGYGRPT
jgi:hypothetical protein